MTYESESNRVSILVEVLKITYKIESTVLKDFHLFLRRHVHKYETFGELSCHVLPIQD